MATVWQINAWTPIKVSASGTLLPSGPYRIPQAGSLDYVWVELLNNNLVSQGPIQFITLTANLYYNAAGSWSMLVPFSTQLWNQMMSGDFFVNINWRGIFSFGGKCEQPGYQDSIPGASSSAGTGSYLGPFIVLSGSDWLGLIANRIAYPDPTSPWSGQNVNRIDGAVGVILETAIKHYVSENIGPTAISSRKNSLLDIAADQGRGNPVTYTVQFGTGVDLNLLDVIRTLITQSGSGSAMGVSLTRVPSTNRLLFDVYIPRNLSSQAWFSESLGNMTSINFYLTDPTLTDALVQGATTFVQNTASARTIWNATEQFIDSSSETVATNLTSTAQQAVAAGGFGPNLNATMNDTPFLTFGRDYKLGDIVSVEVRPGVVYSDVVSAVTLTADMSQDPGLSVIPSIGNSANATATDQSIIGQLITRIRNLEKKLATK